MITFDDEVDVEVFMDVEFLHKDNVKFGRNFNYNTKDVKK